MSTQCIKAGILLTAMPFIPFRLKKANDTARLAHFDAQLTWGDLVLKIVTLLNIQPLKDVSVTYFNKAKDAVTLTHEQDV